MSFANGPGFLRTVDALAAIAANPEGGRGSLQLQSGSMLRNPNTIAFIGDSITDFGWLTKDAAIFHARVSTRAWWNWAQALSGGRMQITKVIGKGGFAMEGLLPYLAPIIETNPAYCVVMVGTNDVTNAATLDQMIARITPYATQLTAAGITPIFCCIPPKLHALHSTLTPAAARARIGRYNQWLKGFCLSNNFPCVDFTPVLLDVATGGGIDPAYYDGETHPDTGGAYVMGKVLAELITHLMPPRDILPSSNDGAVHTNPLMLGNTAGLATDWTNNGGATVSKVARTDGIAGEWQEVDVSGTTQSFLRQQIYIASGTFAVGERLMAVAECYVDACVALRHVNIYCNHITAAAAGRGLVTSMENFSTYNDVPDDVIGKRLVHVTPAFTVPADGDRIILDAQVLCGSGGSATVRWGRVGVVRAGPGDVFGVGDGTPLTL